MKKLFTAIVAAIFAVPSFAQIHSGDFSLNETSVYYGIRLGMNASTFSGDADMSRLDAKTGLTLAGTVGLRLSDVVTPLFLESGLYYTQYGAKENKDEVNLNYFEIPILIKAGFELQNDMALLISIASHHSEKENAFVPMQQSRWDADLNGMLSIWN